MANWFTIEKIDSDTFAISEYKHWKEVHSYLLIGVRVALLIDLGLGVANIKKVVESLTALPVIVATIVGFSFIESSFSKSRIDYVIKIETSQWNHTHFYNLFFRSKAIHLQIPLFCGKL